MEKEKTPGVPSNADIENLENLKKVKTKKRKWGLGKRIAAAAGIVVCALIVLALLAAAGLLSRDENRSGGAAETAAVTDMGAVYDTETEEMAVDYAETGISETTVNIDESALLENTDRKLITTVSLELETLCFDDSLEELTRWTEESGGYIQNSYVYNGSEYSSYDKVRSASLTCRVPDSALDEFVEDISGSYNVTGISKDVEDVTLTYVDLQSRRNALETEEETLLSLMEKAGSVEDIIAVEAQLTEVRYQLESIESQIRTYDNKINYSTVYIYLNEVSELTDTTEANSFADEIFKGFANSVKNIKDGAVDLAMYAVIYLPYIILAVAAVVIIVMIIRRIIRGKK